MPKNTHLTADGITIEMQTAFQSFACQLQKSRKNLTIGIPRQIQKHLGITEDTILEVAVRRIPFKYAQSNYNIDFFPHNVHCPKCSEAGRLVHFANTVVVTHHKLGKKGTAKICFISTVEAKEFIKNYQEKSNR